MLATAAAIIASQALISGAFSLTRQAIQLGYCPAPRDRPHLASRDGTGLRAAGELGAHGLHHRDRDRLRIVDRARGGLRHRRDADDGDHGHAAAGRGDRALGLAAVVASLVTGLFLVIDLAFFGANALKIAHGGWLPLVIGWLLFTLMTTWKTGRRIMAARLTARAVPIEDFLASVAKTQPARVPGTAVFMTAQPTGTPAALAHNLRFNKVLHEHVVTLMITTQPVPHVPLDDQVTVRSLGQGVFDVRVRYGFMEDPNVPEALINAASTGSRSTKTTSPTSWRETLIVTKAPGMAMWRERLFALMASNAVRAPTFFRLPADRVVELGVHSGNLTGLGGRGSRLAGSGVRGFRGWRVRGFGGCGESLEGSRLGLTKG